MQYFCTFLFILPLITSAITEPNDHNIIKRSLPTGDNTSNCRCLLLLSDEKLIYFSNKKSYIDINSVDSKENMHHYENALVLVLGL